MRLIWGLCLLCLAWVSSAVHIGPVRKTSKIEDEASTQEEVNMLMFGVIQLSESLKYVYDTTEATMAKISQTLKRHEGTLQRLGRQTEEAAEVEKLMKVVLQIIQAQMAEQQAQTDMTKARVASLEQEEAELKTKVKRLEMYLNNSVPTSIKKLQERAEEHSDILKGLQHVIQFQKENIDSQDDQLSRLQRMSEALAYF